MKRFWLFMLLTVALCAYARPDGFVTVKGTRFYRQGRPYYFLGTNLWYGAMLGQEGEAGDRGRLMRELDHLKKLGIDNLRVMGASEGLGYAGQIQPAIQPEPGRYDEKLLVGLDFLLAEMAKRDQCAVIFLNNYWEWTGGMSQYISWVTGEQYPSPQDPKFGYWGLMRTSGRFYTNEPANAIYRDFIRMLVNRVNTVNGRVYRDDPAIMTWQLANEPRPSPENEEREQHFREFAIWVDQTAGYIKSLDSNHLVTTGNEGLKGSLESENCYLASHASPYIDYLTFHLWLLNWSWFDPNKPAETWPEAANKAVEYVRQHIAYAEKLGKPITLEEFGIPRDGHAYARTAPVSWRNRYYTLLFNEIYQSARSGSAMAGSNFWGWGGEGAASDPETFTWRKGDAYTGDPPQEPQGRNSVFSSDKSTLKILRTYAKKMTTLGR
ncbi:MAG TPA: cellulase family glycosylhydrolase [bacterium]|nr:cellulase family glycosylhydrolase [bacterium]HQG46392.1 cellulase family glycosylhydrolase [bacterium]HQI47031.1 cellulase family glycosylhydrolase [bacterium]HQJ65730.1 cellulase family glycosylhydrolase [bacterium]